jgi:hypothetical protein
MDIDRRRGNPIPQRAVTGGVRRVHAHRVQRLLRANTAIGEVINALSSGYALTTEQKAAMALIRAGHRTHMHGDIGEWP